MAGSIGLELGASSVRAVSVERQGSRVRVATSAQAPWSGEAGDDLVASLKQLRRAMPLRSPVVLGVPSSAAIIATVTPLLITRAKADLAIQFELQQQLPYDVAQAVWHAQWLDRRAPRDVVVAAVKTQLLDAYLGACRRAGIAVQQVQVNALAAVNLWARQLGSSDAFEGVLLHLDGGLVEWILIRPDGLQVITVPSNPVAQSPDDIIAALRDTWSGVRDQFNGQAPAIIRVCGVPLSSPQFLETLAQELSCAVELFDPTNLTGVTALGAHEPHQLVVACGLAFQGIGLARLPLSLTAQRQVVQQAASLRYAAHGISVLGLLVGAGLSASGMLHVRTTTRAEVTRLAAQERLYQQLRPQIRQELQRQELLEQRLAQLDEVWAMRPLVIQMFQQLTEVMPEEIWLSGLELVKAQGVSGTFTGYARSFQAVTTMVDELKSSVGWSSVKPLSTTIVPDPTTGKELVSFAVQVEHHLPKASAQTGAGGSTDAAAADKSVAAGTAGHKPHITLKGSKTKRTGR